MINYSIFRTRSRREQPIRYPLTSSSSKSWLTAKYLAVGIRQHLRRSRPWRRAKKIFSHALVFWSANRWLVQIFYMDNRVRNRRARIESSASLIRGLIIADLKINFQKSNFKYNRPLFWELAYRLRVFLPKTRNRQVAYGLFNVCTGYKYVKAQESAVRAKTLHSRFALVVSLIQNLHHQQAAAAAKMWSTHRAQTVGSPVAVEWCRIPNFNSGGINLVNAQLKYRMRGRHERRIKKVIFPLLRIIKKIPRVVGCSFRCNGRFTRTQRASHSRYQWGSIGGSDPANRVAQSFLSVPLKFGSVGIRLVLNYGAN